MKLVMKIICCSLVVTLLFANVCQGRHIHPGGYDPDEIIFEEIENMETDKPIKVFRNWKPNRFVPLNNFIFFKTNEPCEEGFQRDAVGICREVWD